MTTFLAGTQVLARRMRWEVVFAQPAGEQELVRLRCLDGGLRGRELDLLSPFENIEPIATELAPRKAGRLDRSGGWRGARNVPDSFRMVLALCGPKGIEGIDQDVDSGELLQGGMRSLFRLFSEGMSASEIQVCRMGGMLVGSPEDGLLEKLHWSERAVALLLNRLLWTPAGRKLERQPVHDGSLEAALTAVRDLEATVGKDLADIELKQAAKERLNRQLEPFRKAAAAWAGGVLAGPEICDDRAYAVDSRVPSITRQVLAKGYSPLYEGKTFHQYTDRWEDRPRYLVALEKLKDKASWLQAAQFYRLAFRDIASSTNERTAIFAMVPPGFVFGNTAPCERAPAGRPNARALFLTALTNAFPLDWCLRQKNAAHVNLFILNGCPLPPPDRLPEPVRRLVVHSALRLTSNHEGYAPLWEEQLGSVWREDGRPPRTWPVLEGETVRWRVRAAIDAMVAQAYGLTRDQYAHVLSSFSHKSYAAAPQMCLAAYDELSTGGTEAFARAHDPYWDLPLNDSLPQPAITLHAKGHPENALRSSGDSQPTLFEGAGGETDETDAPDVDDAENEDMEDSA